MTRRLTVLELAREGEVDVEEAGGTLWDAGIEQVEDPEDFVPAPDLKRARRALGIESLREQRRVDYWLRRTGASRRDLTDFLASVGVTLSPQARTLPKGALTKVRRRYLPSLTATSDVDTADEPAPCEDFEPTLIGHVRPNICYLDEDAVLRIHNALVEDFAAADDPISPPGVKSANLLSSALMRPQTSLGSTYKYGTVELAAAALLHSLVQNHPFHNGNKRTGLVATLVFLDDNGLLPTCSEKELFRFVLRVAQHGLVPLHCPEVADREVWQIALWLRGHSRSIEKGERPIPWLRLRRILRGFDCESEVSPSVGNRINLVRHVSRRGIFGRSRTERLSIQVAYGDDGREVERNTLNAIRKALELDEEHGVDSKAFYEADAVPDDFIQQYRTLLRRLGRL